MRMFMIVINDYEYTCQENENCTYRIIWQYLFN